MSAQNLLLLVAIVVLVIGGSWYYFDRGGESLPVETEEQAEGDKSATTEQPAEMLSGEGSFQYLMGLGRDLTCDFEYVSGASAVAGTVYISGERIRGDFDMEQAGELYRSHMIQAEDMMYTWSESPMGTFAMKYSLDKTDTSDGSRSGSGDEAKSYDRAVSLDQSVKYECYSSQHDDSKFVPPSNIEFIDQEAMMRSMMQGYPAAQ